MKALFVLLAVVLVPAAHAQEYPGLGVAVETVAGNLEVPWSIDWLPNGDALFTERGGNLRMIMDGELLGEPLLSLGVAGIEGGLLGVAVDPGYDQNGHIYLYYTYGNILSTTNKIVRYQLDGTALYGEEVLLDGIPGGPVHDGGRIAFGPDGKLYATTGDAGNPGLSPDRSSVAGKILRINPDGTIPDDNPWEGSPVYSTGHRNPQGMDWDSGGNLVTTDHGPSGERGRAHDEVNVVVAGADYGWPAVIGDESKAGSRNPILHTGTDTWAPSGAEFYDGGTIPQWEGMYFVATLRGAHLQMIGLDPGSGTVTSQERLFEGEFGRLRDVETGPDGHLYLLTSNRDGRGSPAVTDDRILRIVPLESGCAATPEGPIVLEAVHDPEADPPAITVSGCVYDTKDLDTVSLRVMGPGGDVLDAEVQIAKDGTFGYTLGAQGLEDGTYHVTADSGGGFAATGSVVVPEFGQVAAAVAAAAMGAAVIAASRSSKLRLVHGGPW